MAGTAGMVVAKPNTSFYKVTLIGTKDEAGLAAACISDNEVINVENFSAMAQTRNVIEKELFNKDVSTKLVGNSSVDDITVGCVYDNSNVIHTAINADNGMTASTYIVKVLDANGGVTYHAFDGFVNGRSLSTDETWDFEFTLTVKDGFTIIDEV